MFVGVCCENWYNKYCKTNQHDASKLLDLHAQTMQGTWDWRSQLVPLHWCCDLTAFWAYWREYFLYIFIIWSHEEPPNTTRWLYLSSKIALDLGLLLQKRRRGLNYRPIFGAFNLLTSTKYNKYSRITTGNLFKRHFSTGIFKIEAFMQSFGAENGSLWMWQLGQQTGNGPGATISRQIGELFFFKKWSKCDIIHSNWTLKPLEIHRKDCILIF